MSQLRKRAPTLPSSGRVSTTTSFRASSARLSPAASALSAASHPICPVAVARGAEPIGRVEALDRRLAAWAQSPLAERMIGVPFELHHASLAHAGRDAAAGRALAADGPVVAGEPRHCIVGRDGVGDQVAGQAFRTAGDQPGPQRPHRRAEKAASPCLHRTVVTHLWHPRQSWVALRSLWQPMQRPMVKARCCTTVFIAATSPWHSAQATFARTCIR